MSVKARYSGECPDCGERWQPGDLIRSCGNPKENGLTCWHHDVCPTPKKENPVCTVCWLTHPEGACDR